MTRMSKQGERRAISPRRPRRAGKKTGPKKDNLPKGFKPHDNGVEGSSAVFIPKIK
jgi:hypothetical protein